VDRGRVAILARIRRVAATLRSAVRDLRTEPAMLRHLPDDLLAAAFAPVRRRTDDGATAAARAEGRESPLVAVRTRAQRGRAIELGGAGDLRVALIADEPLAGWLAESFEARLPKPEDWRQVLGDQPPHLLAVQDARWGNRGAWQYRIGWSPHPDGLLIRDLRSLTEWCASGGVPTVFVGTRSWPEAEPYLPAASLFDLVIAPDSDTARRYVADSPGARGTVAVAPPPTDPGTAAELLARAAVTLGIALADRTRQPLPVAPSADAA
jgi:hypothetical protein